MGIGFIFTMRMPTRVFYYDHLVTDMFDINGEDTANIKDVCTVVVILANDAFDAYDVDYKDLVIKKLH